VRATEVENERVDPGEQAEVLAFLARPSAWPNAPERVEVIETHGALVFLAGEDALKVKRAVRLSYLDFSTLEARHRFSNRELEINRPHAPELYSCVVPITREADGTLRIDGAGTPVEWAVKMRRFGQDQLMSHVVDQTGADRRLASALGDMVAAYHAKLQPAACARDPMPATCAALMSSLETAAGGRLANVVQRFGDSMHSSLTASAGVREARVKAGCIRRCHGDLHLANIVLIDGQPVPFDAIEFDEAMATIDTLYDLAFLIMDLWRHGAVAAANTVLNRYLWRTGEACDLDGLAALPLFLGARAGVRALVAIDRARLGAERGRDLTQHAGETLELGIKMMTPERPRLIAIGGLSGTGKSTLAAAIAPLIGAAPGAVHLRSDLERKRLAGVDELERLPSSAYTPQSSAMTYERLLTRAHRALAAGHSVVVDAVYARDEERRAVTQLAASLGVPLQGLWLEAPSDLMTSRVSARRDDASDATVDVVEQQRRLDTGEIDWTRLTTAGSPGDVEIAARRALGLPAEA